MGRKSKGKRRIPVVNNIIYSNLIFFVASGKNYALSIAKVRNKKDSSPTAKQLKQLEERGFLKSRKEKLLNKTIYSINWSRIIEEFKKFYDDFKKQRIFNLVAWKKIKIKKEDLQRIFKKFAGTNYTLKDVFLLIILKNHLK